MHQIDMNDNPTEPISWARWKARLVKTLLAFGFFAGNLTLNAVIITLVHERYTFDSLPLPDVAFDILPYWPNAIDIVESFIAFLHVMLLFVLILHRNGYRIAQRYFLISSIVFFLRAISIAVTNLPVSENRLDCAPKVSIDGSIWQFVRSILKRCMLYAPSFGIRFLSLETLCGHNLYSGHAVNIVIAYSFLSAYVMPSELKVTSLCWWMADCVLYSFSIIAMLLLLIARSYYTIDILIAYIVSSWTFYIYHTVCSHESLHYSTQGNLFTKFWWWPLFVFFEVDNPGRIAAVNRFYNPIDVLKSVITPRKNCEPKADQESATKEENPKEQNPLSNK